MRQLHWFQNDLRLADNPALASATAADSLLCVYLMPNRDLQPDGPWPARDHFLRESLQALKATCKRWVRI